MMKAILISGLTQRFGSLTAVDGLTLELDGGEVFGLLGPNGSGKTTVLNLVNGLSRPSSGSVTVYGVDPVREPGRVRALLGMVPQETALYDELTAQENLEFHAGFYGVPARERKDRINRVLALVELTARRGDRVSTYSGGMRRRLALARALITEPKVILLDEPTLGVDVQARAAIWNHIRQLRDQGKTILVTTNVMEEADALCDRVAIIDRGKLVALGTPDQLKERVGGEMIEVEGPTISPEAFRAVEQLPDVHRAVRREGALVLTVQGAARLLPEVLAKLKDHGVAVTGATLRRPNMNDVFLNLTGRKLRD